MTALQVAVLLGLAYLVLIALLIVIVAVTERDERRTLEDELQEIIDRDSMRRRVR